MARKSEENPRFGTKERRRHIVWAVVLLVVGLLWTAALWDYDWRQNPALRDPVSGVNKIGVVGLFLASKTMMIVGRAAFVFPFFLLWLSGMLLVGQSGRLITGRVVAWVGILFSLPILFDLWTSYQLSIHPEYYGPSNEDFHSYYYFGFGGLKHFSYGGWIGYALYSGFFHKVLGSLGSFVVFGALLCVTTVFVFFDNLGVIVKHLAIVAWKGILKGWEAAKAAWARFMEHLAERRDQKRQEALRREEIRRAMLEAAAQNATRMAEAQAEAEPDPEPSPEPQPGEEASAPEALEKSDAFEPSDEPSFGKETPEEEPPAGDEPEADQGKADAEKPAEPEPAPAKGLRIVKEDLPKKAAFAQPQKKGDYEFPTLDLLAVPPPPPPSDDAGVHQAVADQLVKTLAEFGVKVTMGEVHPGPVITRYDLYPAAGVRVEKIQNLDKNLALALCAMSVRILAPVPGKGCVGVEIPNKSPQSVFIRDILESEDWVKCKAEIPIALGKEVSGKPLVADLTKMPHMLIAGATGSGKTVCINSIVASLLYKMSPDDLRFVMVDPKIVEMQVYNALPHMLIPVVTDPRKVPGALKYLINEMERRYRLFASVGVRNIAGYNAKRTKDKEAENKAKELDASLSPEERAAAAKAADISVPRELDFENGGTPPEKLPYIVCIVDELADLMMVAPADVETGIARLAQLARAAGIHLIIATQRPSVNVITGIIKANLPSRIAFKVASKVDSRTILDYGGADQLIGRGDMLFMPPGIAELVRSQGAFVADEEINGIVAFVNEHNGEPEFDEQFQRTVEESAGEEGEGGGEDGDDADGDALIPDALEVIRTSKRASTSMLQRRLRIGYNRAARIMELLEERGYVGPENGSMPREILRDLDTE
jgi:S-DNA-T family DNA segregation ATPase FtsK/SpoIIIE